MAGIFISYRRSDAEGQAGRLYDDLAEHFGKDHVFMDVVGIEAGRDFRHAIDEHVTACGVLLAVIGKDWVNATDAQGQRRLDSADDFVRLELATALKRDVPVIPVLVRGATMPQPNELPPDCADLCYRNGVELTHARWDSDVQLLIRALTRYVTPDPKVTSDQKPGNRWHWLLALPIMRAVAGGGLYAYRANEPEPKPVPVPTPTVSATPKPTQRPTEKPTAQPTPTKGVQLKVGAKDFEIVFR